MRSLRKLLPPPVLSIAWIVSLTLRVGRFEHVDAVAIGIIAAAVFLGLVVGLVAELLLFFRRKKASLFETASVVVVLHALAVAWSMARSPGLYARAFYERGGLARTAQVIATDVLGPTGVVLVAIGLAVLYVRPARVSYLARRALRPLRFALPIVLGLSCSGSKGKKEETPNVLVLGVSRMHADRLDARTTPALAALAARSTRFDHAYVSSTQTLPSWVTLLTGRHAHHHGIRSALPNVEERTRDFDALPGRFTKAGWATAAAGAPFMEVDLGFERVLAPATGDVVRKQALARQTPIMPLLDSALGRTLFPTMRDVDPNPLRTANDVESAIAGFGKKRWLLAVALEPANVGRTPFGDSRYRGRFKYGRSAWETAPSAEDDRQIRALYDGALRAADDAAARILGSVDLERTIVVVIADHGGDTSTHVPLFVFDPRRPARRETKVVRDVDLAPTLYEIAGVPPPDDLDGRSAAGTIEPRLAVAEVDGVPRMPGPPIVTRHRTIRDERWKLVYVPRRRGADYRLFDTLSDPTETNDVAAAHAEEVARLRSDLWAWMLSDPRMEQREGLLVPRGTR